MLHKIDFLQLFAESGGDGGAPATGGESSASPVDVGNELPANMPERAKKYYEMAKQKREQTVDTAPIQKANTEPTTEEEPTIAKQEEPPKRSFKELIESDDYKADYERHIQRAVKDRTKRHDTEMDEVNQILAVIGQKYGLDSASKTFRVDLAKAVSEDDSMYERYAEEHDIPIEEARTVVNLKQQLDRAQKEAQARREAEEDARVVNALRRKGEETKALYPDFDLDSAMKDERFRRMTVALNGDTTAAWKAINHDALVSAATKKAAAEAKQAVANSVRSNLSRPAEGGISSTSNNIPTPPDFRSMGLNGLRTWAQNQRNKRR